MIRELITSILAQFGETLLKLAPYVIAAGIIFPILSWRFACNAAKPWWRSPDLVTDLAYWFVVPVLPACYGSVWRCSEPRSSSIFTARRRSLRSSITAMDRLP